MLAAECMAEHQAMYERVPTRAEKKVKPSISDFPGVLRQYKRNYDVPTLDQLSRAEKLYLLRSCGLGCVEFEGRDAMKCVESAEHIFGTCKYFTAVKCDIYRSRRLKKQVRLLKKEKHLEAQREWYAGGRERHYLSKYRYGNEAHTWFARRLAQQTGMPPVDPICQAMADFENLMDVGVDVWGPPTPPRPKWNRVSSRSDEAQAGTFVHKERPQRSVMLLFKLRAYIRFLRSSPMRSWNVPVVSTPSKWECGEAQMEGAVGESNPTLSSGNVVLSESNLGSESTAAVNEFRFDWHQLCSSEKTENYDYLTDRFTYYKTVEWKTSFLKGADLEGFRINLPVDFVDSVPASGNMPMFIPFKIYKYFKSDIEIRIHVNSNKFQVGQLQFSWQYMEKYDGNPFLDMYLRSQLPHVVVNAGSSNEAVLKIPYKYVQPYMSTTQRKGGLDKLYLGTLRCFVVAPLAVGESGPDSCNVSLFIKFPNAQFTGMRDGSIAEPQMMAAAATMIASAAYDKYIGDKNCDNPSVNVNPSYLVPTGSHSWCVGNNAAEQLQGLRLDASARGVGRIGIDDSETSIGVPCRTFGMLRHFEWSIVDQGKNLPGTLLWSCDAHAQLEKSVFYKVVQENALDAYSMPPTCVVASMFKQWRGSLEFKFDIIASQFHTGRLLCAYIPGFYGDASKITLAQARNSPCVEFSLEDSTNFTFVVPYISDKVFWPRKYTGPHKYGEVTAPSKIVVFILNPLIPMQSIVNKVTIVPYFRAGVDFEVSVPVQPSIGLTDESKSSYIIADKIYPTTGSYPYYVTNYKGFGDDTKYIMYEGTAALGTASTFHAPERRLRPNEYYYGKAENSPSQPVMKYISRDTKQETDSYVSFIVLWNVPGKGNFGIPFPSGEEGEREARLVAKLLRQGAKTDEILGHCYSYIKDSAPGSSDISKLYFKPQFRTYDVVEESFDMGEPEMEDQRIVSSTSLQPTSTLPSTSCGKFNFNEDFSDLKTIARRYQLYAQTQVKINKGYNSSDALITFPVIPHGLNLDIKESTSVFNLCRDGHIPIISSGYIYYRGSIRFRLILSADSPTLGGVKVWIQHHPDGECKDHTLSVYPNISLEDRFQSHTYSVYVQPLHVNSIIEFEVPFYQPGMYGLTRQKSVSATGEVCQYYSLGNILIGAYTGIVNTGFDFDCKIYYSIGDDFSFSTFRGFPAMVFTDEVWPEEVAKVAEKEITWITGEPEMEEAQPQMFARIKEKMLPAAVAEIKGEVVVQAQELIREEVSRVQAEFDEALQKASKVTIDIPFITNALGNLAHVVANPNPKTIAISIANIIIGFFSATIEKAAQIIKAVIAVVEKYWHRFVKVDSDVEECAEAQMEGEEWPTEGLCALIFVAVSSVAGVAIAGPKKFPDILRNINTGVSLYNNVIRLIQNSAQLISFCIKYITSKIYPETALAVKLTESIPSLQAWYKECTYLLDVRNKSKYLFDNRMVTRVYDACTYGNIIVSSGLKKSMPGGRLVIDTHKEMKQLMNNLVERGKHPDVRFETFPLFIYGAPGIGKSFMADRLINDLLKSICYSQSGSLIYTIPSGAKYWSGCNNPAALISDDLFQVTGTKMEEEIANIFAICSTTVLNPPMAAVEDKERRINPLIYLMFCNSEFPNLAPTCRTPEAIYRRRKFLINVRLCEEYRTGDFVDASHIDRNITKNLGHLEFAFRLNVKDPESPLSEWMTYEEMLMCVRDEFKRHYANERENFVTRMKRMYCLDPDFDESSITMDLPELDDDVMPLAEQVELYRSRIQDQVDALADPTREPTIWEYMKKAPILLNKYKKIGKMFNIINDVEYIEPQMEEPGPSDPFSEQDTFDSIPVFKENFPELFNYVKKHSKELAKPNNKDFCSEFGSFLTYFDKHSSQYSGILGGSLHPEINLKVRRALDKFFSLDCGTVPSYFFNTVRKMLHVGAFDSLTILQFFLAFSNGPAIVGSILYDFDVSRCPRLGIDVSFEEAHVSPVLTDVISFNNEIKKYNLRSALKKLNPFKQPHHLINDYMRLILNRLLNKYKVKISLFMDLFSCDWKEAVIFHNFSIVKNLLLSQGMTHHTNSILSTLYFNFILCKYLIGGTHKVCRHVSGFELVRKASSSCSYCSIRDIIEVNEYEVCACDDKHCVYSNELLYYTLALSSVSCKKYIKVCDGPFGRTEAMMYENCDIIRAVRNKSVHKSVSLFRALYNWLKHLFLHRLPEALSGVYSAVVNHLPKILLVLGIGATVGGLTAATQALCAPKVNGGTKQGNYFKFDKPKVAVKNHAKLNPKNFASAQMSSAIRKAIARRIEMNTVLLHVTWIQDGAPQVRSCRNLMLRGRSMLVLRHYYEEYQHLVDEGYSIECFLFFGRGEPGNERVCKVHISWDDLNAKVAWCSSSSDKLTSNYGIVVLPNYVQQFKDITKLFATNAEHNNVSSFADMYVVNGESNFGMPLDVVKNFMVAGTATSSAVYIDRVYRYNKQYKGLCGSVVVCPTLGSGAGAIIGLHVAGNQSNGYGYAEPVYREMFNSFFNAHPEPEVMEIPVDINAEPDFELDSNLMVYGCVPKQFAHKESGKTKIIPSMLHGKVYEVKTEVNPLKPGDPRQPPGSHPLRDGCNKHGSGDVRVFDSALVEVVKEHMCDRVQQIIRPIRAEVKPLSLQQAVCGDVDVPYFESLNWKSSEGFPLSSFRPSNAHDKKWLFDLEEGQFGYKLKSIDPKLDMQLKLRNKCFEQNIKPPTVYVDCLKDYRLTPEKCKQPGKTRIFSIAPVQCSIDIRMYMNDFCASLKNSRIVNSIGIGINPDSLEWTKLAQYLFEVGNKIITLDYSNFGPCLMSQLVAASNDVIVSWHANAGASEEHVKRVKWLLDSDILNPVHLSGNVLYQTVNGISSGSPLTGECNSIPNLFYIRLTYLEIMREVLPDFASMYFFDRLVRLVVYGDDLIMSVDDSIAEAFNAITIRDSLAKHGIKVTPAQKDSEMVPYTSIYEATFLKRSFVEHPTRPGVWLAPVEKQSIEECINWIHKSTDDKEATLEVCRASLDLAYSQGPEYYQAHYKRIVKELNTIGLVIECYDWHTRDRAIFGDDKIDVENFKFKVHLPWTYQLADQQIDL